MHIFYIMGRSATGKDHIYKALLEDGRLKLQPIVLYTTRPKRKGEIDGVTYHFSDTDRLEKMRAEGRIIEERVYQTVAGPWHYFTAADGQTDPEKNDYLGIGTLESWRKMVEYYGREIMVPLYIETDDDKLLERSLKRERKQKQPNYKELCRRFLADSEDFSEEKLSEAGITKRFPNNAALEECIDSVREYILGRSAAE